MNRTGMMFGLVLALWLAWAAVPFPQSAVESSQVAAESADTGLDAPTTQPTSAPDEPIEPVRGRFAGKVLGNIEKSGFPECSGIVYHPTRKTLFVISDAGRIGEFKLDGTLIRQRPFLGMNQPDTEGVTVNPADGRLYVAIEGRETIMEVDPETLKPTRLFPIPRIFKGRIVMKSGGNGLEAITFIPKRGHPHGGVFWVANQSFDLKSKDDISAIFEVEVELKSKAQQPKVRILRAFTLNEIDLAGLYYDAARDRVYVVSDRSNILFEVTTDCKLLARWTHLPGRNQEGVTVDPEGYLYLPQDSGGIIKIKWLRAPKPKSPPAESPPADARHD